ncbi:MAG TPA: IS1595 family transposase [Rhizomicrobium sp.]|nr:IS1595 family transposase [Rhizomicrobium sp.]
MPRKLSVREFFKRFPDEDTCLEHVMDARFGLRHTCGKCGTIDATFHRLQNRKAYACAHCGDNLYPCAGTIFQDSRTPLQVWFYAIYLFTVSRNGVSGMELHRTLGVTRKTGYRIGVQIRKLMRKADYKGPLGGHCELDETYVGGVHKGRDWHSAKTIVMGMKERGGALRTEIIPNATMSSLHDVVIRNIEPGSVISTDEWKAYSLLTNNGFHHGSVNHSQKEWAVTDDLGNRHHVNGLENFWKHFKSSVRGTHVHVSRGHMPEYLGEFTYRANHREMGNAMFDALIAAL